MKHLAQATFEVVAVSVGKIKTESLRGHDTETAIVRKPCDSIQVHPDHGIVGNRSAVHDAQVYALAIDTYSHWTNELGLPEGIWGWCFWGGNICIRPSAGLDESTIFVGDTWQIGDAVFEVVGGRVPCSRLAWRCGQPDSWLKPLSLDGRCGTHPRALKEGTLRAGDIGCCLRNPRPDVSVAATIQLAFEDDSAEVRDAISRCLAEERLLGMNRAILDRRLNMLIDQERKRNQVWQGWKRFSVTRIHDEAKQIKSIYLTASDGKPLAQYIAGQHVVVRLPSGLTRVWSLSDWFDDSEGLPYYRLTVKSAGLGSNELHTIQGKEVQMLCPRGSFHFDADEIFASRQVYISAGVGISPIYAMLRLHTVHDGLNSVPAIWIHVDRDESTMPFKKELKQMPELIEKHIFFTRCAECSPEATQVSQSCKVYSGRPTESFYKDIFSRPYFINPMKTTKPIEVPGNVNSVYICGPTEFETSIRSVLSECGVSENLVLTENFAAAAGAAEDDSVPDIEEAEIICSKSKKSLKWQGEDPVVILDLVERAGIDVPRGCGMGICGSCESRITRGEIHRDIGRKGNVVRACIARPASAVVELDI